jgi:hypothetical protein
VQQTLVSRSGGSYRTVLTLMDGTSVAAEGAGIEASFGAALLALEQQRRAD